MGKGARGDSSMEGVSPTKSYGGVGRQETPQTNQEYRQSPVLSPPMPGIPGMERPHPMMPSQPPVGQPSMEPSVPPPAQGVGVPGGQMGQPPGQSADISELLRLIMMSGGGGLFR